MSDPPSDPRRRSSRRDPSSAATIQVQYWATIRQYWGEIDKWQEAIPPSIRPPAEFVQQMLEQLAHLAKILPIKDKAWDLMERVVRDRSGAKVIDLRDLEQAVARAKLYNLDHVKSADVTAAGNAAPGKTWKGYAAVTNLPSDTRPKLTLKLNVNKDKVPNLAISSDSEASSPQEEEEEPLYRIGASDHPDYGGCCVKDDDDWTKAKILSLGLPISLQIKKHRYIFRQATEKEDVLDWIDRERGAARYTNQPTTPEEINQLVNNIRDLLNMRLVIEDGLNVVEKVDRAEAKFISVLEDASVAFAKLLDEFGLLPLRLQDCKMTMLEVDTCNDEADDTVLSGSDGVDVAEMEEESVEDGAGRVTKAEEEAEGEDEEEDEEEDGETSVTTWL